MAAQLDTFTLAVLFPVSTGPPVTIWACARQSEVQEAFVLVATSAGVSMAETTRQPEGWVKSFSMVPPALLVGINRPATAAASRAAVAPLAGPSCPRGATEAATA